MSKFKKRKVSTDTKRQPKIESLESRKLFSTVGWDCPEIAAPETEPVAVVAAPAVSTSIQMSLPKDDHSDGFMDATYVNLDALGNGSVTGKIEHSGDQDMIRIVAPQTGQLTITQDATDGRLDTYLYAYDGNGNMLGFNDDGGPGLNSRLQVDVVQGESYYVRADAYRSSTGEYQLSFNTELNDDHGNDIANATPVSLNADGSGSVQGNIEQAGDQDMIRLVAAQTGQMTVTQDATAESRLDTYLYAYDSDGNMLAHNDDGGPGFNSELQIDVVEGETYYVRADAYGYSSGEYALNVSTEVSDDHGNYFTNATAIDLAADGSGTVDGNIEQAGDQDMIRLVATETGRMTVTQDAATGSRLDTYLYAYDSNGNQLARNDDGGPGLNSRLEIDVVEGETYFVRADAFSSSTGEYQLNVSTERNDDHGDGFADATTVALDSDGSGSLTGNIEESGDQDMIRLVATETGRMTVTQDAATGSRLDTYLYAYDSNGNQLARNDDGGPGLNSRLEIDVVAGQTYFVRADAYSMSTGEYQLNVSTERSDDHGDGFADATTVALDSDGSGSLSGNIEEAGDQDMIRFIANQTGRMTITQDASVGSGLDTYLYAYDSNGNQLALNDDGGPGLNSRLEIDVVAGQTYFVRADAYRTSTGSYQLNFGTEVSSNEEDTGRRRGSRLATATETSSAAIADAVFGSETSFRWF